MMPEQFNEEILSAYLDGELPGAERAAVERWLETSESARRTLAGLQRTSALLRELPACELPAEFASQIMQQAERQMLLPAATAPRSRRRVGRWILAGAPLAAVAAGVLVMVLVSRQQQPAHAPAIAQRFEAPLARDEANPTVAMSESVRPSDEPADRALVAQDNLADSISEVAKANNAAVLRAEKPAGEGRIGGSDVEPLLTEIRNLSNRGLVPVLRVSVVDRMAGLKLVQYVLEQHRIGQEPVAPAEGAPGASPPARPDASRTEHAIQREGLLVIAETEHLGAALQQLLDQTTTQALEITPPLEPGALDERGRQQIVSLEKKQSLVAQDRNAAQTRLSPLGAARAPAPPAQRDSVLKTQGTAAPASSSGIQMPVTFTDRASEAKARLPAGKSIAAAPPAAATRPTTVAVEEKQAAADPAVVRVIILIEGQPTQESRPVAPEKPARSNGPV